LIVEEAIDLHGDLTEVVLVSLEQLGSIQDRRIKQRIRHLQCRLKLLEVGF